MTTTKANNRKEEIIHAAFTCISEKGYDKLTMQAISEYAKMSKGAISYYYPRKEDILIGILEELDRKLYRTVDSKISNSNNTEIMLRSRISGSLELTKDDPTLMYVLMDFSALSKHEEKYARVLSQFFKKYRYLSSMGIKPGVDSGIYRKVSLSSIGVIMMGIIVGVGIQWVLDEESFEYSKVVDTAEDMLLEYLKNK